MKTKVTVEQFKKFAKDVAPAAKAVLMARIHAELTRERVDAYIKPVFDSFKFTVAAKWAERGRETIDSPRHVYLSDDEPKLAAFFEACDVAHRQHGFTGPKGHCPALVAENLLLDTENALIELAEPLFGIEVGQVVLEKRTEYLKLLIDASVPFMQHRGGYVGKDLTNEDA